MEFAHGSCLIVRIVACQVVLCVYFIIVMLAFIDSTEQSLEKENMSVE